MNGYRIRIENVLHGLAAAGKVDLFCTVSEPADLAAGAAAMPRAIERTHVHRRPAFSQTLRRRVAWLRSGWPRAVAGSDWRGAEEALGSWARASYDLVWFSHCDTWLALGRVDRGPVVVDFDNLEDERRRLLTRLARLQLREGFSPKLALGRRLQLAVGAPLDRLDGRRWARLQRAAGRSARAVVVCSELDRQRLGFPSTVVVPNGYFFAASDAVRRPPGEAVLTMVGWMAYPPNVDGARFFVHRVLPLIRREIPTVRFRLVGRHSGEIDDLRGLPGVEILGELADLDEVFASTSAVVVCLRAGSGTRIKVLEGFARSLPVVATTVGCEGLDARDGIELLVGDTPEELAAACLRVLSEPILAASIAEAGHRLWSERYRSEHVREQIRQLAVRIAGS
jgi:glycosyltransferase involved in cell wall biosynthesis